MTKYKDIEINKGDILQTTNPKSPWQHFIVVSLDGYYGKPEVRDNNAWNIGQDDLEPGLINIGHYSKHPEIFDEAEARETFPEDFKRVTE